MKLTNLLNRDPITTAALKTAGFADSAKLLNAADVLEDPSELAELLGVDAQTLLALVGRVELLSLQGMGEVYVDLLTAAGIETKSQLSACNPFELHAAIKEVAQHTCVGRVPNRATVEYWIEQARQ